MKKLDFLKISFIIRKDRLQEGKAPIYLQLFLDSQRARISINQKIDVDLWDENFGRVKGNNAKANHLNEYLDKIKLDAMRAYNEKKLGDEDVSIELLRKILSGESQFRIS